MSDWLFEETLRFGNGPPIGVVTFWTHPKKFSQLSLSTFRVMGNLYSEDGVNYLARNILAHPNEVRILVVCGSDGITSSTGVREAILNRKVNDPYIPAEEVTWLKQNLRVVNGGQNPNQLPKLLTEATETLSQLDLTTTNRSPVTFPFPEVSTFSYPSEVTGIRVISSSIYEAWIGVLKNILRFGVQAGKRKILLNMISVVGEEDRLGPIGQTLDLGKIGETTDYFLPDFLSFDQLVNYLREFLIAEERTDVTYTYGNRMLAWGREKLNLVDWGLQKLQRNPQDSQVVLGLWDNRKDTQSTEPPCLTQIILNILEGKLYLTGSYRSHDMYRAYVANLSALRYAQILWARELGVRLGKLTTISTNAHIYEWDLNSATQTVMKANRSQRIHDPRGNIAVTQREGETVVMLYSPGGRKLTEYQGRNRRHLLQRLLDDGAFSQPDHIAYATALILFGKEI